MTTKQRNKFVEIAKKQDIYCLKIVFLNKCLYALIREPQHSYAFAELYEFKDRNHQIEGIEKPDNVIAYTYDIDDNFDPPLYVKNLDGDILFIYNTQGAIYTSLEIRVNKLETISVMPCNKSEIELQFELEP